jgi:hypothetical protein
MRVRRVFALLVWALAAAVPFANGQSTNGMIRGQLVDAHGVALQGATVTVTSDGLQGNRVAISSEQGDYIVTLLPPGRYAATFELSGFRSIRREFVLAPTQVLPLDVTFTETAIEESVQVVGTSANVLTRTAQLAVSFPQALISALPTNRDINASVLMAPSVHPTGANGGYSLSGSVSFENLFMVNGVSVSENLRGQPYDLYVEDAIQETSVATTGISAEYGRFTGGIVNVITKSGGNTFSGSFRDTLQNDSWRAYTPFEQRTIANDPNHADTRVNKTVPTYEFTFGGPALKDRLWFFTSGRQQTQESARTLVVTNVPYVFTEAAQRFEINATYSPHQGHRLQAGFIENRADQTNASFNPTATMDRNSLYDQTRRLNLFTLNYSAPITARFFLEARASVRNETLIGVGSQYTDLIQGTLLVDRNQRRYWSPTFCGVCDPEERDGADAFIKGSYFLSTKGVGSHDIVFGYDGYNDQRFANNHQSGSDYRIVGTTAVVDPADTTVLHPQLLPDGVTQITWQPIQVGSEGANFRTHSLFVNDLWRGSNRVSASLGLRYDRNHGTNSVNNLVADEAAWSPRIGITIDPTGGERWSVTGSFARYVAGLANTMGDASSPGGNPDTYNFAYLGPAINANPAGPFVSTPDVIQQALTWFDAAGGPRLPLVGTTTVKGVTPQIRDSLTSPNAWDYSAGVSRQLGMRGSVRADVTYRAYHDFYAMQTDLTTGRVTDTRTGNIPAAVLGRQYDLTVLRNTDVLERQYAGVAFQSQYRVGSSLTVGGAYTLARLWGNAEGETTNSGPIFADVLQYPEYKRADWNTPVGDLSADQRHRARIWGYYTVPQLPGLMISVLQILESGVPYGAVAAINSAAYVANPGYVSAPSSSAIAYYYTDRDAFRTEGQHRTDLAINYAHRVSGHRRLELFGQLQILNLWNHYQLCGCGAATVFQNGGSVIATRIDQTVRTSITNASLYSAFNPFTTTPQRGVNWDLSPNFGTALNRFAYTTPRTLRLSFGVRF